MKVILDINIPVKLELGYDCSKDDYLSFDIQDRLQTLVQVVYDHLTEDIYSIIETAILESGVRIKEDEL